MSGGRPTTAPPNSRNPVSSVRSNTPRYVSGLADQFVTDQEGVGRREWEWVMWYDAPMQVPGSATLTYRQIMLELQLYTGNVWLTCEQVSRICAAVARSFTGAHPAVGAGPHGVVEDVAVSLYVERSVGCRLAPAADD